MSESNNHAILKIKALEYLYLTKHCKYVTTELKIGDYIFDCIGTDGTQVFIIEAKQAKADFLSDCNKKEDIRAAILEYRKLLTETADVKKYKSLIEKEQAKSYKMYDPALHRLAAERYIISPEDLIKKSEVPDEWGLLEVNDEGIIIKEKNCPQSDFEPRYREFVIKEIARRNTKLFLEGLGVEFGEKVIEFPKLLLEED
jgi:hypothetical protein